MSLIQHAFMHKARVPSRDEWQAAIDALGYDFKLYPELRANENSGFLPCTLKGSASGFEIYYEPAAEYLKAYPDLQSKIGNRDWCITFRWGANWSEGMSALVASAALIDSSEAIIYYPDDNLFYDKQSLSREIEECTKHI